MIEDELQRAEAWAARRAAGDEPAAPRRAAGAAPVILAAVIGAGLLARGRRR
jgi:hypothetical protein